jgi:ferredoxin
MADPNHRNPENQPGRYYVDDTCIDCDLCRSTAPAVFRRNDDGGYTYVHHQPVTLEEIELAEEARLACPTESIGNDGPAARPNPDAANYFTNSPTSSSAPG